MTRGSSSSRRIESTLRRLCCVTYKFHACLLIVLLFLTVSLHCEAQEIAPGLTLQDCRRFISLTNGIAIDDGRYALFIQQVGARNCYMGPPNPTAQQTSVFLTLVCVKLRDTACSLSAVIEPTLSDADLQTLCLDVDQTIRSTCPDPTPRPPSAPTPRPTPNPVIQPIFVFPTRAPDTPSLSNPLASQSPNLVVPTTEPVRLAPGVVVADCREDLLAVDQPPVGLITEDEYNMFLNMFGARVCYPASNQIGVAGRAVFNQFRCLTNVPCLNAAGIQTANLVGVNDVATLCARSYTFAMAAPVCPDDDEFSGNDDLVFSPTMSPTRSALPTMPFESSFPSSEPSFTAMPSRLEPTPVPTLFGQNRIQTSSATLHRRRALPQGKLLQPTMPRTRGDVTWFWGIILWGGLLAMPFLLL